ncbi:3-hydroxybutyryl-CoA dehydrogenase 3-hydroxyacyl-CoA dehydrogenase [Paramagnetospirillum magnetotacticum MS-1]|uniref:3-hydroxybutyryl-CoA dehydrogenase 3-hydroxyacyl-CoA dehydrogenase n=1 Tax=Paramagnetospirillum magnetotacticum MS-1 TaxID=272627 RepID=A0A0C2YV79_PARME|nr:3-hydroxyacyl-CoA dehydrogenase [Paramagnetospirillum magnetotacticum]KIL99033.1 3-hydroxybutyryl-CoA dehydrogenase 3-hydroxyacyl-CoA dehydrogenase [Paramagnetospirillum magnetotacticum MS-1]
MSLDANRSDLILGLVGTGTMGRGIAQIAVMSGVTVILVDAQPGAAAKARDAVAAMLAKLAEKGKLTPEACASATARLKLGESLADLAPAHVVVEAIVEDIKVKQALMKDLEAIVSSDCLIASNTSSLSVTSIAAACKHPERVGGFHFFNPVPLMKVVEVIDGVMTAPWVVEALITLARRMGHTPVKAKDTPGFVVNHAGRGYGTEALKLVGEGVTDVFTADRILKGAAGFRMGPFELLDLTALDVSHPVMESIYDQYYQEPRFRPSPITRSRLVAGLLGRKTGRGFYAYEGDKQVAPPAPAIPTAWAGPVWVAPGEGSLAVSALVTSLGVKLEKGKKPTKEALCLVPVLGEDCTTAVVRLGLDATRAVAIDPLFGLEGHRTLMTNPVTEPEIRDGAHGLLAADGVAVSVICDSPGLVAQRVVATIVNIGCDIAQQRIATPEDIDKAVTLGLGYPAGPLSWGDRIGAAKVVAILDTLLAITGDPRYRASLWLKRRALLGVSLLTSES